MYTMLSTRFMLGYLLLAFVLLGVVGGTIAVLRDHHHPGLNIPHQHSCLQSPSSTAAFDQTKAGDVVYRFVYDNVFRQDLSRGWALTTAKERAGLSYKEWLSGSIPVVPEPVSMACTLGAKRLSDGWGVVLKVNGTYYLAVVKKQRRWLVDYFMPMPHVIAPQG